MDAPTIAPPPFSAETSRGLLSISTVFATLLYMIASTIVNVALPHMQVSLQATQAGILLAARGISSMATMLVAGLLVGRFDLHLIMAFGIGSAATSLWLMGNFSLDTPGWQVASVGLLQGFGAPLTVIPLAVAAFGTLPGSQRTDAGALLTLIRNIDSSVGVSAAMALLARSAQVNHSYLAENFTPYAAMRWAAIGSQPDAPDSSAMLLGRSVGL